MSYSIYILEDEEILRKAFIKLIPWKTLNLTLAGECGNGDTAFCEALSLHPDIIFCDIKVPGKNGLDMIKELRNYLPDTKFIILSGYQEFEYAKKAIDLNVEAYLLKPVKQEEISSVLEKTLRLLEEEKVKKAQFSIAKNTLLLHTLENADVESEWKNHPFSLAAGYCVAVSYYMGNKPEEFYSLLEKGIHKLSTSQMACNLYRKGNGEFGLIFSFMHSFFQLQRLEDFIKQLDLMFCSENLFWAFGNYADSLKEIPNSYHNAKYAWSCKKTSSDQHYIFYEESLTQAFCLPDTKRLESLKLCLQTLSKNKLEKEIDGIFKDLSSISEITLQNCIDYIFYICFEMVRLLHINGIRSQYFYESCSSLLENKYQILTLADLRKWTDSFLFSVSDQLIKSRGKTVDVIVEKVQHYIDSHYQEDISLNACASIFHVNTAYLSTTFKKITGMGFSDYLTGKRMETAKILLTGTALGINEIAVLTGYDNTRYFSQSFRKYTGITPTDYRNAAEGDNDEV